MLISEDSSNLSPIVVVVPHTRSSGDSTQDDDAHGRTLIRCRRSVELGGE
jgi:hypothetical protein